MPNIPRGNRHISDSPSATSNGARLVSATPAMKYTMNNGSNGSQNQFQNGPVALDNVRQIQ